MKLKLLLIVILGMVFLSACGGSSMPYIPATATPGAATPTLQAAMSMPSGTSISPGAATPDQPAATLPPVFDLTRTEDNPITDAQQIIEILQALESIERSQSIPPGWYLRNRIDLINPDNPEQMYDLYHVIDEELNCDLAMEFLLSPDGNFLGLMFRNYGTPIWSDPFRGPIVHMEDDISYTCNLSNPNLYMLYFYSNYSDTFSMTIQGWSKPGAEQWGDYSFSAWFENEDDQTLFVLQEDGDNMRLAYRADPDTQELVAMRSRVEKTTYSVDTGRPIGDQSTAILANNKTSNSASLIQLEYYQEKTELPPSILAFLEESLLKYDEMQLP